MKKRENIVIIVILVVLVISIVGVSYAAFSYTREGTGVNKITTGDLSMEYTESDNVISISNALPTTDRTGMVRLNDGEYFDFTITSSISNNTNINYEISAKEEGNGTIDGSNIKLYLTEIVDGEERSLMNPKVYSEEATSNDYTGRPASEMSLYQSTMNSSEEHHYRLRMYVDEEYNPQGDGGGLTFAVRVNVYGMVGDINTSQVNTPELDSNMIAVYYNGSNWAKADSRTDSWYNYDNGEWANAVTVSEETRDTYESADIGTVVSMDDIETMWVWIPRYSYSIGSEDGTNYYGKQGEYLDSTPTQALPGEIDVKFVTTNTKDRGTGRYIVEEGIESNDWYTPDAFTFDGEELSGIWVGKFETSSSNPSASSGGGNTTTLDAMIKPNVTSWRNINVSNIHTVSTKVSASGNRYGFSENMNSHAMKSDEWASIAYLSQSKYGKLGNTDFSGANKEVYQNKSDSYITGCSYGSPSNGNTDYGCQYTYDMDINGTGASTTGNIYGVYDMSGGAWEYVMANYNDMVANSGFESMPEAKYYNKYTSNNISTACNGSVCLSHGLSETAGWYGDSQTTVSEEYPWLLRGGSYGSTTYAGVFLLGPSTPALGGPSGFYSFRLVMSETSP